ncbi:MAG TPA: choice-of-anchor tandem repeat GloVer-containing protein [Candidatus Polarisedimenticolia bacterium]|nr:choice-of-anchor tandem repeat GloVer-containing protein [Candidatus Polarisedimenticolia bacterium]
MKRRLGKIAAAFLVLVLATAATMRAQTLTVLHSFTNSPDGALPFAGLLMDAAGNLYSTTLDGGIFGFGTVFKLDPAGNETVLHSFTGSPSDGGGPSAALIMDAAGNLSSNGTGTWGLL